MTRRGQSGVKFSPTALVTPQSAILGACASSSECLEPAASLWRPLAGSLSIKDCETHLVISKVQSSRSSRNRTVPQSHEALADVVHNDQNLAASISSGSFKTDGMVIALFDKPCPVANSCEAADARADVVLRKAAIDPRAT
jgi:3-polyprenyl-4-hydroxybenzoate decarboxylase